MLFLAITAFAAVAGVVGVAAWPLVGTGWAQKRLVSGWQRWILFSALLAVVLALFRPHEHSFQGLDASAFRLMAKAFADGRGVHEHDDVFKEVPDELRSWFLLKPDEQGRKTRDRSFETTSLQTCETKPFFYPLLPLCMNGMDALLPFNNLAYFMPLICMLYCAALIMLGFRRAGAAGGLVGLVLIFGNPLPAWFARGCFLETASGILLGIVGLSWCIADRVRPRLVEMLALGLSVSFHPVMIVLALPMAGGVIVLRCYSLRNMLLLLAVFSAGMLPLLLMTLFVAAPYGVISIANLRNTLLHSSSIRPTLVMVTAFLPLMLAGIFVRQWFERRMSRMPQALKRAYWGLPALWIIPTFLAVSFWEDNQGRIVMRGLMEMLQGFQWPFGLLIIAVIGYIFFIQRKTAPLLILTLVALTLPLFLYLKGAEHVGLWSQRRLVAPLLITISCCIVPCCEMVEKLCSGQRLRRLRLVLVSLVLIAAGSANALRWPAPYVVSYERGSDAWVAGVRERCIGDRLTVFDYHPFSVPFAVDNRARVLGVSEFGGAGWPDIISWLKEVAAKENVQLAMAYRNPGLEDGVVLKSRCREEASFPRVHAKGVLPAVRKERKVSLEFVDVVPVSNQVHLVAEKVFDGGILAMRGPWGRQKDVLAAGQYIPAQWTREGSGLIGPVPPKGGKVTLTLKGIFPSERRSSQVLQIQPPWPSSRLEAVFSNQLGEVNVTFDADADISERTGVYRFYAVQPYNPGEEGIRGYSHDLGVMLHSVRIEEH